MRDAGNEIEYLENVELGRRYINLYIESKLYKKTVVIEIFTLRMKTMTILILEHYFIENIFQENSPEIHIGCVARLVTVS